MKEIITICIGQCGVQLGHQFWKKIIDEHKKHFPTSFTKSTSLFKASDSNDLIPRTIFIDLDPTPIDQLKKLAPTFNFKHFVKGSESSSSNYVRGSYTLGREILEDCLREIQRLAEDCSNLEGFLVLHSIAGGTGSGLTSMLLSRLRVNFDKKLIVSAVVTLSPDLSNGPMEIYNTCGYFSNQVPSDVVVLYNNEGLYSVLESSLDIRNPDYSQINELVAHSLSSILLGSRENNTIFHKHAKGLGAIVDSWVPYPDLKYIVPSLAPIESRDSPFSALKYSNEDIVESLMKWKLLRISSRFQSKANEYKRVERVLETCLIERGSSSQTSCSMLVDLVDESQKKLSMLNSAVQSHQFGAGALPLSAYTYSKSSAVSHRSVSFFTNSDKVNELFKNYDRKIAKVYEKRAFCHWILGEGIDNGEYISLRYGVSHIIDLYSGCESL